MAEMETTFIENLKYVFRNLGITKAYVAKMCGVSKATVSMWLAGRKPYRQSIEVISELISSLLFIKITPDAIQNEDIKRILRMNEVKIVIIRKMIRDLSDLNMEDLVTLNEYVQRVIEGESNTERLLD